MEVTSDPQKLSSKYLEENKIDSFINYQNINSSNFFKRKIRA